jgi:hypothetical protein
LESMNFSLWLFSSLKTRLKPSSFCIWWNSFQKNFSSSSMTIINIIEIIIVKMDHIFHQFWWESFAFWKRYVHLSK